MGSHAIPILYSLLLFHHTCSAGCAHFVNTTLGLIRGTHCKGSHGAAVTYLGLPFAKPPVGGLRWSAPQPYDSQYPASGFDATRTSAWCPQSFAITPNYGEQPTSEDCLYLNVWAPASATQSSKLPVRVFIHGGSYLTGSGGWIQYDGCQVVQDADVLSVTMNYRLGALGFLALPDLRDKAGYDANSEGTTGNWGLLDQRMALVWVRDNIAAFGGDPNQIVLHGESAGGQAVFNHMMMPGSFGLYSSAISQSGDPDFQFVLTLTDAYMYGDMLVQALGCNATGAASRGFSSTRRCMLAQRASAIVEVSLDLPPYVSFTPVVDGVEFLKNPPDLMKEGCVNKVPFMVGVNRAEGSEFVTLYFLPESPHIARTQQINESQFLQYVAANIQIPEKYIAQVLHHYHARNYNGSWFEAAVEMTSQSQFFCPSHRGAGYFASTGTPVYAYVYTQAPSSGCWITNGFGQPKQYVPYLLPDLNSSHTTELPEVFMAPYAGKNVNAGCTYTQEEAQYTSFISGAWTSMAMTGKPLPAISRTLSAPQLERVKTWPQFNNMTKQAMNLNYFNPEPFTWDAPDSCHLWDEINEYVYQMGTAFP